MALPLNGESPPLRTDESGTIRIGTSRITLDLIVEQYQNGMSPEDMVRAYSTLELAEVYSAIAYYLHHQEEVDAYLQQREQAAATLQAEIEHQRPRISKEELVARRGGVETVQAPTGE